MQLGAPAARGMLLRGRDTVARTLRRGGSNHSRTSTMSIPVARDRAAPVGDVDEAQNLAALLPIGPELKARIRLDRKSTRLNSSNLVISYAAFCLKKKNKTNVSV